MPEPGAQRPQHRTALMMTIIIVAIVALALAWYYYGTAHPVIVTGTVTTLHEGGYINSMSFTNIVTQQVYSAQLYDISGPKASYNVTLPPGQYSMKAYWYGLLGSSGSFENTLTVLGGRNIEADFQG